MVDIGVPVATAILGVPAVEASGASVLDWLVFAALPVTLIWRRSAPVAVYWLVLANALAFWFLLGATVYPMVAILLALYAVARHRPPRHTWAALGALRLLLGVTWAGGETPQRDLVTLVVVSLATALLGSYLRTRQAYISELTERARRLEQDHERDVELAAVAERSRIAREMHDIVAHNLAVIVALADGSALMAAADPARATGALPMIAGTGRQALAEMHRLVGVLRDGDSMPLLTPQPSVADIAELIDQVRAAGLRVAYTSDGEPGDPGTGASLAVYRLVQEALTNTLKHAGPYAMAQVELRFTPSAIDIQVTDDGGGRSAVCEDARTVGHGIAGMIERTAVFDGHVTAGPTAETGWRVQARLNLPTPTPQEQT